MPLSEPHYRAYLLRCWQEPPAQPGDAPSAWRFALEQVAQEPQRYGFNSLEAVFVFLQEALADQLNVEGLCISSGNSKLNV